MTTFNQKIGTVTGDPIAYDILVADYSSDTGGINLDYTQGTINSRIDNHNILTFSDIDAFVVTGTQSNDMLSGGNSDDVFNGAGGDDILYGKAGNDNLLGGDGNDYLIGGDGIDYLGGGNGSDTLVGGSGDTLIDDGLNDSNPDTFFAAEAAYVDGDYNDLLISDYSVKDYQGPIHFGLSNHNGDFHTSDSRGNTLMTFSGGIGNYHVMGTQLNDIIDGVPFAQQGYYYGNDGDDVLNGGFGNDGLYGGAGDDILNGKGGNDNLDGGVGNDQLHATSGSDNVTGGVGDDVIYATSDVNTVRTIKHLSGGDGNDRFILDVTGEVKDTISFNTDTLAQFVNAITLPDDNGIAKKQLATDIIFDSVSFAASFVPTGGPALAFATSLVKTGFNTVQTEKGVKALIQQQQDKAIAAAGNYTTNDFINTATTGERDLVIIDDFQIGKDTITLPHISGPAFFTITGGFSVDANANGAFIQLKVGGKLKDVAFITNNYTEAGMKNDEFVSEIMDLMMGGAVGKFCVTPVKGNNNAGEVLGLNEHITFANDRIYADGGSDDFENDNAQGGLGDTVFGYYGDDIIRGEGGDDKLWGGTGNNGSLISIFEQQQQYVNDGNDTLIGGDGDDMLKGESGDDYLNGDSKVRDVNDNFIFKYAGNDTLYGGDGDDLLEGGFGNDALYGENGNDRLSSGDGSDSLDGGTGDDVLIGEGGNDTLNGQDGNDVLVGDGGGGVGGNDVLVGAAGNDALYGQEGNDSLYGGLGNDTLQGGLGDDLLNDTEGSVSGGDGVDTLQADYSTMGYGVNHDAGVHLGTFGGVSAVFERNDGVAVLNFDTVELFNVTGTNFNDHLEGGAGNDTLNGGGGDDDLFGNAGNDVLNGGLGNNAMEGGQGNDTYIVSSASDFIIEAAGGGIDTVKSSVSFSLDNFVENLTLTGTIAVTGNGNALNNVMTGNNAANTLLGFAGNDKLNGGAGNDLLNGGSGNDNLTGGLGSDKFWFNAALGATNKDVITGFNGVDDTIVLENDTAFTSFAKVGAIAAGNFVSEAGAVAHDSNDFLIYNTNNGALSYDADGSGAGAAVQFATLVGVPSLSAADFLIV